MDYLSAIWTAVYYVAYPIFYTLNLIFFVLAVMAAPFLHFGHYCLYACWYALRVLAQFETLYIFFGIAALVGIVTGTSLHYVMSMLDFKSSSHEQRGRTLPFYRAEKQERWDAKDPVMRLVQTDKSLQRNELKPREDHSNWRISKQNRGRSGNRINTILEEEDSSDGF